MAVKEFDSIEFVCPHCGKVHKVAAFIEKNLRDGITKMDSEYSLECLLGNYGQVRLSFPYCECECGQQFIIDFEECYCVIYDDQNGIVDEIGYNHCI